MTTLAYDGKTLCADKQVTRGSNLTQHKMSKLRKGHFQDHKGNKVKFMFGLCGDAGMVDLVASWFVIEGWQMIPTYLSRTLKSEGVTEGCSLNTLMSKFPNGGTDVDFDAIFILDTGEVWAMSSDMTGFIREEAPYTSGDGGQVALGAMLAGADAKKAVAIASDVNCFTGHGLLSMTLPTKKKN